MAKNKKKQQLRSVDITKMLIEYRDQLKARVEALRAEACQVAAKVRSIDAMISDKDLQELADQKKVDDAYTIKSVDDLKAQTVKLSHLEADDLANEVSNW